MFKKGFTILELLVVIVILGILVAILLPALGGVRESGRRIQCLNNLRQHGMAWYMYIDDHNDTFPPFGSNPKFGNADEHSFGGWEGSCGSTYSAKYRAINPYLEIFDEGSPNLALFHCPNDIEKISQSYPVGAQDDTNYGNYGNSYSANPYLLGFNDFSTGRPLRTITSPRDRVYLEKDRIDPVSSPSHGKQVISGNTHILVMVLFVDGHVAGPFLDWYDFEYYNPDTSKKVLIDVNGTDNGSGMPNYD